MKTKIEQIYHRFVRWNGFLKLPILCIFVLLCLFVYVNARTFSVGELSDQGLQVYFFDVGQASSALVIMPDKTSILIDTGQASTSSELVSSIDSVLKENSLKDLDILILSHSDADHVGGTVDVLNAFNPETIYRPLIASLDEDDLYAETGCLRARTLTYQSTIEAVWAEGCDVVYHTDFEENFGGATLHMYAPLNTYYSNSNSYSPYITVEFNSVTFLFTGDTTTTREDEFMDTLTDLGLTSFKVDVLEVAHHGSKYSTTEEFLNFITPTYAVVSAGDSTHPSEEVIERLQAVEVEEIFVTKTDGTICMGVSSEGEIIFSSVSSPIDYTSIVVALVCVMFMIFRIIDQKLAENRKNLFIFRKNLQ